MAELYRKSALEKISSPEQLDKALTVTSPMSWLALIAVTLIVVVTVIWSFVGRLPVTVTSSGIVASPDNTNAVYSMDSGTITAVLVTPGTHVYVGTPVATCLTTTGESKTIYSDQVGVVGAILVKENDSVTQGKAVLRITPYVSSRQVTVLYVKLSDAKKLERGSDVKIYLASTDSQSSGYLMGRVVCIDSFATSQEDMAYVVGSGNSLVNAFQSDGSPVVAVTCEFYPDEGSVSGYYWSNEKGREKAVTNGSLVSGKIIVQEVRPITKLFYKLEELWGD